MQKNLNPFSSKGRITRGPFVIFSLIYLPFFIFLSSCIGRVGEIAEQEGGNLSLTLNFLILCAAVLFFQMLVIFLWVKRLRDIHTKPYMSLLSLVPIIQIGYWVYLATAKSDYE